MRRANWLLWACFGVAGCGGRADLVDLADGGGGASSGDVAGGSGNASGAGTVSPGQSAGLAPGGSSGSSFVGGTGGYAGSGSSGGSGVFAYSGAFVGGSGTVGGGSSGTAAVGASGSFASSGTLSSGSFASGTGYGGSGVSIGTPPGCNFPLPNLCAPCSGGEVVCAHYALRNGTCVVEICPPSTPAGCTPGALCPPGSGCASAGGPGGTCSTSCRCDPTGHLQCAVNCPPPPPVCAEGAPCSPGTGCATATPYPNPRGACSISCACDPSGLYQCTRNCPPPCSGLPLPALCQQCGDGTFRCAHYVDIGGMCVIETCPPSSPTCAPGAMCAPNTACHAAPVGGCSESCWCDTTGRYVCNSGCAQDAGVALDSAPLPVPPPIPLPL